eukprot:6265392-Prorocentrum_lima.AAC.1
MKALPIFPPGVVDPVTPIHHVQAQPSAHLQHQLTTTIEDIRLPDVPDLSNPTEDDLSLIHI